MGSYPSEGRANEGEAQEGYARLMQTLASPVPLPSQVAQRLPAAAEVALARLQCYAANGLLAVGPQEGAEHQASS